eukprot:1210277-Amorphochlora_amoeboformis.AAC.1
MNLNKFTDANPQPRCAHWESMIDRCTYLELLLINIDDLAIGPTKRYLSVRDECEDRMTRPPTN